MVKHTQTIRRLLPTNCLSVFDHFVGLALKELKSLQTLTLKQWFTILQNILVIVSSLNFVILILLKCLKNLDVTGFLPSPGGPMAVTSWTSCNKILEVSFLSYLLQIRKKHYLYFTAIYKNASNAICKILFTALRLNLRVKLLFLIF